MSNPTEPHQEHPSTYFVQDRSNDEELARLQVLDQIFTAGMGGVLPEQPDPTLFRQVLDVGCGTGGWLIETAKTYPNLILLVGVDISRRMLDAARAQAQSQGVHTRVQFRHMDALRLLEFPSESFDLVNHRSAVSWLRTWDWSRLLREYLRVTRSGGVIRVSENDMPTTRTSPALSRLLALSVHAFSQAGHFFPSNEEGATCELAHLLQRCGVQSVQTHDHTIIYRSGTTAGQLFAENVKLAYRTMVPFLRKWVRMPEDYEAIYQQMLDEMQQPDFVATIHLRTAWGTKFVTF